MVKISTAIEQIQTSFKSIKGSEVTIKTDLTGGDFKKARAVDELDFLAVALSLMITKWNLEGDDGEPLKITSENVNKIGLLDQQAIFISTEFGKKSEELAKKKENSLKVAEKKATA